MNTAVKPLFVCNLGQTVFVKIKLGYLSCQFFQQCKMLELIRRV